MAGHILHAAVIASIQPPLQVLLVFTQINAGDANLLEAELISPLLDIFGERDQECLC